jgi:HSP20 family protein
MRTVAVDPLRTLRPLREAEVELLTSIHEPDGAPPLAYDVFRSGDELVIEFDAPGVASSDISLTAEGRALVVSVRRELAQGPGIDVIESGRQHGTFRQRLWLGDRWDAERLRARVENGVLIVHAPLAAQTTPRPIEVSTAASSPATTPHAEVAIPAPHRARPDQEDELVGTGRAHSAA